MRYTFNTAAAKEFGVQAAALLDNIYYCCKQNKAAGRHIHDGRVWMYNSMKAFAEIHDYMSKSAIHRELKKLETGGAIVVGHYGSGLYSCTGWYAITDEWKRILEDEKRASNKKESKINPCQPYPEIGTTPIPESGQPYPEIGTTPIPESGQPISNIYNIYNNKTDIDNTIIDNNIDNTGIDNSGYIPPLPPVPAEPVPKEKTDKPKAKRKEVVTKEAMETMVYGRNFPQSVHDAMMDWIGYKISRGEPYTEIGFRNLLTVTDRKIREYGEASVSEVIMESMGNSWKGIIWDRMKSSGGGSEWLKKRITEVNTW